MQDEHRADKSLREALKELVHDRKVRDDRLTATMMLFNPHLDRLQRRSEKLARSTPSIDINPASRLCLA